MNKRETKNVSVCFPNETERKIFVETLTDAERKLRGMMLIQTIASVGMLFFLIGFAIYLAHSKGYPFNENVAMAFVCMGFGGLSFPLMCSVADLFGWIKDTFF